MIVRYRIRLMGNSPDFFGPIYLECKMRLYLRAMVAGSLVGGFISAWFAPRLIAWWFEPPIPLGFSCRTPIEYALRRLQWAQLIGILVGAAVGLVILAVLRPKKDERLP